jgi:hypothetical protein
MKSKQTKLVIIDGCGSELLDVVLATVNYEASGDGAVLVHTDDLNAAFIRERISILLKIQDHLNSPESATVSKPCEGLILLRR